MLFSLVIRHGADQRQRVQGGGGREQMRDRGSPLVKETTVNPPCGARGPGASGRRFGDGRLK